MLSGAFLLLRDFSRLAVSTRIRPGSGGGISASSAARSRCETRFLPHRAPARLGTRSRPSRGTHRPIPRASFRDGSNGFARRKSFRDEKSSEKPALRDVFFIPSLHEGKFNFSGKPSAPAPSRFFLRCAKGAFEMGSNQYVFDVLRATRGIQTIFSSVTI